jgi:predicted AlkP superfamily phosphohydrolase/phosphomutase
MTGKNPGKHGVFGFMKLSDKEKNLRLTSSTDRKAQDLWEIMSAYGKKVAVIRVPVTYPTRVVNGILVSGFMTPPNVEDYIYPISLRKEIEQEIGELTPPRSKAPVKGDLEASIIEDLKSSLERLGRGLPNMLVNHDWDFFMVVFQGTDEVQHRFWHLTDPKHPKFDRTQFAKHGDVILHYYQAVDKIISSMLEMVNLTETTVVILSDHGARALHKWVSLNNIFWRNRLLAFKRDPWTRLKLMLFRVGVTPVTLYRVVWKLNLAGVRNAIRNEETRSSLRWLMLSLKDLDWSATKVYALGGWGQIYLNRSGIQPGEYEDVRRRATDILIAALDPTSGQRIFDSNNVMRREQVYQGSYLSDAPDLIALPDPPYQGYADYEFGFNSPVASSIGISGTHSMNGILILRGPAIKADVKMSTASIMDVAPTILYLMGLPIPNDMDGKVLSDAIRKEHVATRAPAYSDEKGRISQEPSFSYSAEEEERLKKSLKDLGYL